MDLYFLKPSYTTTITPLSPNIVIEDVITPIIPTNIVPTKTIFTPYVNTNSLNYYTPYANSLNYLTPGIGLQQYSYYYDTGIGENPLAQHETNQDLRYLFLDKWLYDDHSDILRMLKVDGNAVKVLSKEETEKNDISSDSESTLEKKSDFIGSNILTLSKNKKIMGEIIRKNNVKWYMLEHMRSYVSKQQGKYVKRKLEEMRK
jgi:hypothetical protein